MLLQVILEGLGLGVLLVLICAAGICKGAVGMVHLYSPAVQQRCVKLGLTSPERIRRNSLLFKAVFHNILTPLSNCDLFERQLCDALIFIGDRRINQGESTDSTEIH